MNINCPKCNQEYEVEESMVGQEVECQQCDNVWTININKSYPNDADFTNLKDAIISEIWNSVKTFVCANLKAPATAIFESDRNPSAVSYLGNKCFEINSTVDSQNSYGALVRNYFTVILFYGENGTLPIMVKINEQANIHTIKPKEINCLLCRNNFFHDVSFEPETLLCPFCGKETTYIDMSPTGCLKKIILAIVVIPILVIIIYGIYCFIVM